jgi:hypothetical protein
VARLVQYLRDILPVMLLRGIGAGLAFPSLTTLAMSEVGPTIRHRRRPDSHRHRGRRDAPAALHEPTVQARDGDAFSRRR